MVVCRTQVDESKKSTWRKLVGSFKSPRSSFEQVRGTSFRIRGHTRWGVHLWVGLGLFEGSAISGKIEGWYDQEMSADPEKYDRQIRLWGEEAQGRLEGAHICLLNGSAVGTEVLKNLVLPGVGAFTVVDGCKVTPADIGSNFFTAPSCIGKSRALVVTELLQELNSRVRGYSVEEEPLTFIERTPTFFEQFTVVVAAQIPEESLLDFYSTVLLPRHIPLILVRSYGLIGFTKIVTEEHTVVQTHPDNPTLDLRIANPWPALQEFIRSFRMETLDSAQHSHVPYIVILAQHLQRWREMHSNAVPANSAEKDQFKQGILKAARDYQDELNFQEAHASAYRAWATTSIPSDVRQIFADPKCSPTSSEVSEFWIVSKALKEFVDSEGTLPLIGSVPDLTTTTDHFVTLQKLYQEKAEQDAQTVAKHVDSLLESLGPLRGKLRIPLDTVRIYCKNAYNLKVLRYRLGNEDFSHLGQIDDSCSSILWYCGLHAVDSFSSKFHRLPGAFDDQIEADIGELRKCFNLVLGERGLKAGQPTDDILYELCRYGGSELHTVSAFIGGVAAQELVKVVTRHFVPLSGIFLYNGITCTGSVL
ncbi:NEDD8-activating enzyme E1 regulatory subunit [Pelomyxa schiedti]|nr:NEDD8-activating enzyme E1 regulatory subunit [Pelomyxa schiedti]